jgi:hypothetical protein
MPQSFEFTEKFSRWSRVAHCASSLTVTALLGCSSGGGGGGGATPTGTTTQTVTYQKDIRTVIEADCLGCHVSGGIAPFELDSWDSVNQRGGSVVQQVTSGAMPPWPADNACHPLRAPASLPDETRNLFAQWKDAEFPEGNVADYKAPAKVSAVDIGDPTVVMAPTEPYVTPRDMNDNYRCFLVDGQFDKDTYITAVDIRPGQPTTVHHVQIHTIPAGSLAKLQANDAASDGPGWTCGIGSGPAAGDYNLFSWRPGTTLATFEPGDGVLVEAGTQVYIQVHYNTQHLVAGAEAPPDLTHIACPTASSRIASCDAVASTPSRPCQLEIRTTSSPIRCRSAPSPRSGRTTRSFPGNSSGRRRTCTTSGHGYRSPERTRTATSRA